MNEKPSNIELRDWLAATVDPQVKIGGQKGADEICRQIGIPNLSVLNEDGSPKFENVFLIMACIRYAMADGMLIARELRQPPSTEEDN